VLTAKLKINFVNQNKDYIFEKINVMNISKDHVYFGCCFILLCITLYQQYRIDKLSKSNTFILTKLLENFFILSSLIKKAEEEEEKNKRKLLKD
jgi:hypothetical protein